MTTVIAIRDRYVCSDAATGAEAIETWDIFTRAWPTDAHYQACAPATNPVRRLRIDSGVTPTMVLLVVDVDGPGHARTPAWDADLLARAAHLPGSPWVHWTPRGARIVYCIDPTPVTDPTAWRIWYLLQLVAIHAVSGIIADPACCDWPRLHRVPHGTRDGVLRVDGWVCGEPTAIGRWPGVDLTSAETHAALASLRTLCPAWEAASRTLIDREPSRPRDPSASSPDRAMRWALRQIAAAGNGQRNATLYAAARWLALADKVPPSVIVAELTTAARAAGLTHAETARTIRSALDTARST